MTMCYIAPNPGVSRATGPTRSVSKRKKSDNSVTIISQNVRGLKSAEKVDELFNIMSARDVFAACLQETWRSGKEMLQHDKYRLIMAGLNAKEMKGRRGSQGVAIALSPKAELAWAAGGSETHDDLGARALAVRLAMKDEKGKELGIFLVAAYAPVGTDKQEKWDDFFAVLDKCILRKRSADILYIGGDTNSSMGVSDERGSSDTHSVVGAFGIKHVNDSGQRFKSYLATNNLCVMTTRFRKRSFVTWVHPRSKMGHQIDHIITCRSDAYRFLDAGVTSQLVDSDHCAVYGKLYVAKQLAKRATPRERLLCLDYSSLSTQEAMSDFNQTLLTKYREGDESKTTYIRLAEAATYTTRHNLSRKQRAQPTWFANAAEQLLPLIRTRNQAMMAAFGRRTRATTDRLRQARHEVKRAVTRAKNQWLIYQCDSLNESVRRGTKDCWDTITRIKKGMVKSKPFTEKQMKKTDGTTASSPQENAEVFRDHFEKLFVRTPSHEENVVDDLPQKSFFPGLAHVPTDDEIISATRRLKNKAPGASGLSPQIWKSMLDCPETFAILKSVLLEFWETENTPEQWEVGLLKILAKKGDLSQPGNYRGIVLLETLYKIAAIILHDRLQPVVESIDHEEQCGFRPQRGCSDGIFTVKLAIKKRREHGLETWVMFLDLVKAFDRVPRQALWEVLKKFGVPPKIIRLLQSLHAHVTVEFTVCDVTHTLDCTIGVKQGDILGPTLFTFYIAAIMITWRASYERPLCLYSTKMDDTLTGRRHTARGEEFAVTDSEYADDTAVMFPSREDLDDGVPKVIAHFARWGMEIHTGNRATTPPKESKTEILFVSKPEKMYKNADTYDGADLSDISLGQEGVYIPVVNKFCYLGSWITRDGRDDLDVDTRIEKAGAAFGALRKSVFGSLKISMRAKKFVYIRLVLPILLYGSELWCLTEKSLNKLRLFHARCIRTLCRVTRRHTRTHRITTSTLLERVGLPPIDNLVTMNLLRWAGHVMRMGPSRLPRKLITAWVREPRPRGCPQFTYGRGIYKALKKMDVAKEEWYEKSQCRDDWREMINSLK